MFQYVSYGCHYCCTGCQEKSMDGHETDDSYNEANCNGKGNHCSGGGGGGKNCVYRNDNNSSSCSPLLETTADVVTAYNAVGGGGGGGNGSGAAADDWQLVQADFVDVPPGSDTSIRCVVQPPPDMLATHVCVEVGLVKSSAAAMATAATDNSDVPTIVLCSVDVEPCRQPQQQPVPEAKDMCSAVSVDDDDDVLDRISQDLDYLLNRKALADSSTTSDRNPEQQPDVAADVMMKKRTKL